MSDAPACDKLITYEDILAAHKVIHPYVHLTPVMTSSYLDQQVEAKLFFKCENLQKIGAFKMRGACHAIFSLANDELARGVLTHSSGNHGQAVALAAKLRGIPATVVMPSSVRAIKKNAVAGYGAKVVSCGPSLDDRMRTTKELEAKTGAYFIHPFDDRNVIAGQGTVGVEFSEQVPDLDWLIVPLGGGGLISGVSVAMLNKNPKLKIIGVEPENANDAQQSLKAGKICHLPAARSIADGLLASHISALTYAHIQKNVYAIVTVADEEILAAMQLLWQRMKIIVEPSGAVGLAALLAKKISLQPEQRVGLILSGGNVDFDVSKIV